MFKNFKNKKYQTKINTFQPMKFMVILKGLEDLMKITNTNQVHLILPQKPVLTIWLNLI